MSLSPKNLSSIQKAGQAVHDSSVVIADAVRTQAQGMVTSMATAPFSAESDLLISRFKTLSKLSQGLGAVEAQLQELYAMAADLANPASDVILSPAISRRKAATNSVAVDVIAKPTKPVKLPKKAKKARFKSVAFTANDDKLLAYLQVALKGGDATAITGTALASGSGLPLGSVGVSLKKIIATGAVNRVGRGTYQLDAMAAALAPEPVVKSAPAKKVKAVKTEKAAPANKARTSAGKKAKSSAGTAKTTVETAAAIAGLEAAPL
jgi:hypothetical protein